MGDGGTLGLDDPDDVLDPARLVGAVFPDMLEQLFGVELRLQGIVGRDAGEFEALTLGTLAIIVVVGLIGYWFGRDVRAQGAAVPIEAVIPPSPL